MDGADRCTTPWQGRMASYRTSSCTPPSLSWGFRSDLLLLGDFCWVLQPDLPAVLCKDVSKELVELLKLFKCLIPVETCLDALENPIRALACTFKHLNTFENAFFDHLGIEGQGVSRGFVLLTHLLLPKEIFGFVCVVLMSHVTFPFHCITCVIPWWRTLNNSSPCLYCWHLPEYLQGIIKSPLYSSFIWAVHN